MDDKSWDVTVPIVAFFGWTFGVVGAIVAIVAVSIFDGVFSVVAAVGMALCGAVWVWHLTGHVEAARAESTSLGAEAVSAASIDEP